jgi:hypothetical protein
MSNAGESPSGDANPEGSRAGPIGPTIQPAGCIVIAGTMFGVVWAVADWTLFSRGFPLPTPEPLGILRGLLYLPLFTAIILRGAGLPVDITVLSFALGILVGVCGVAVLAWWTRA